jgi:hypothetical protein
MTNKLLNSLICKFPNDYQLGSAVRQYHLFCKENENLMSPNEIDNLFILNYIDSTSFQFI